jgi:hypothetical protein
MSISARRKLIEIELTKIRGLAEQVNDDYVVYFIDMAISEVEARLNNYRNDNKEKSTKPVVISGARKSH